MDNLNFLKNLVIFKSLRAILPTNLLALIVFILVIDELILMLKILKVFLPVSISLRTQKKYFLELDSNDPLNYNFM